MIKKTPASDYVHKVRETTNEYICELLDANAALRRHNASLESSVSDLRQERVQLKEDSPQVLAAALKALGDVSDERSGVLGSDSAWTAPAIEAALRTAVVDGLGIKPKFAFGPLRTAVSGARISPPLFESMEILGKTSTLARLQRLHDEIA